MDHWTTTAGMEYWTVTGRRMQIISRTTLPAPIASYPAFFASKQKRAGTAGYEANLHLSGKLK